MSGDLRAGFGACVWLFRLGGVWGERSKTAENGSYQNVLELIHSNGSGLKMYFLLKMGEYSSQRFVSLPEGNYTDLFVIVCVLCVCYWSISDLAAAFFSPTILSTSPRENHGVLLWFCLVPLPLLFGAELQSCNKFHIKSKFNSY